MKGRRNKQHNTTIHNILNVILLIKCLFYEYSVYLCTVVRGRSDKYLITDAYFTFKYVYQSERRSIGIINKKKKF